MKKVINVILLFSFLFGSCHNKKTEWFAMGYNSSKLFCDSLIIKREYISNNKFIDHYYNYEIFGAHSDTLKIVDHCFYYKYKEGYELFFSKEKFDNGDTIRWYKNITSHYPVQYEPYIIYIPVEKIKIENKLIYIYKFHIASDNINYSPLEYAYSKVYFNPAFGFIKYYKPGCGESKMLKIPL